MRKYIRNYNFSTPQMLLEDLSDYLQEFFDKYKIADGNLSWDKSKRQAGARWYIVDGQRDDNYNKKCRVSTHTNSKLQ